MTKTSSRKGFTLIELLVVISIISLLSSVVLASLNSARLKSRNATRLSGIHTLVNAFDISFSSSGTFPTTATWACVSASCYQGWAGYTTNSAVNTFLASSLPQKPIDPNAGGRGYGGFLYFNPTTYGGLTGALLTYLVEPGGNCGPGKLIGTTANYISCVLKLD